MRNLTGRLTAEALGTFGLIYFGCGAVVADPFYGARYGLLGIALTHAIVLGVMVTATLNVSGGHINPAVTLGLLSVKRIAPREAVAYVLAQLAGGVLGALVLKYTLPFGATSIGTLGTPALANSMTIATGSLLEAVLTFFLMSAVMGTAVNPDAPKVGGFAIGLVLFFDIIVGGTLTGAAMNPARAFGPALVSGTWYAQPVWWIGPIVGAVAAAQVWERVILRKSEK
ncbi:MAG TPA: aquaporin [Gemmatimonadales bacterium]|nr:aquaporin [Gemmatimonadales bacterium]